MIDDQTRSQSHTLDAREACGTPDLTTLVGPSLRHKVFSQERTCGRRLHQLQRGMKRATDSGFGPSMPETSSRVDCLIGKVPLPLERSQNALSAVKTFTLIGRYGSFHRHHAHSLRFPSTAIQVPFPAAANEGATPALRFNTNDPTGAPISAAMRGHLTVSRKNTALGVSDSVS